MMAQGSPLRTFSLNRGGSAMLFEELARHWSRCPVKRAAEKAGGEGKVSVPLDAGARVKKR